MLEIFCKRLFRSVEIFFVLAICSLVLIGITFMIYSPNNPSDTKAGKIFQINFQDFQADRGFTSHGGFVNTTENRQEINVPHEGIWYLIIKTEYENSNPL
jgi:hypothetical protein